MTEKPKKNLIQNLPMIYEFFFVLVFGSAAIAMLFAFYGWTLLTIYVGFSEVLASPDFNNDGRFTILDIPYATCHVLFKIGESYQGILSESKLGQFLEMSSENPNTFWSVTLSCFGYFLVYSWGLCFCNFVTWVFSVIKDNFLFNKKNL